MVQKRIFLILLVSFFMETLKIYTSKSANASMFLFIIFLCSLAFFADIIWSHSGRLHTPDLNHPIITMLVNVDVIFLIVIRLSAENQIAALSQMSWLMKTAAIELRVTSLNRQRSHTQRLLSLLLDDQPHPQHAGTLPPQSAED